MRIPRVDCFSPSASQQLQKACTEVGFFYLEGHRIPVELQQAMYSQMKAFFHLPLAEKQKAAANKNMRGWAPMYEETLDPVNQSKGDTKEAYHVCRPTLPDEKHLPLHDTDNVFPDPNTLPDFRSVTTAYFDAMSSLGLHVAHLFAAAAGVPGMFETPGMFDRPMAVLRMLHYNAEPSDLDKGIIGAGAHCDYGLLTLLSTDSEPGLQIRLDGEWIDVPHVENAFIVNVERWTNGLFKSTEHRVVNTTGRERYSIPFFFEPNFNCLVTCFPSCVTPDRPAKYPPILAGENLLQKYRDTHASYTS